MADLYIIHGWTYTVEPWRETLALLREKGIKVKMLNVPGLTTDSKKVFSIDDYVKWADSEIPDGAIALGHSNGGRILLNLCAKKPDKLKYLILL
ncbi:alpha/beta fold hydrolase, partial [Candidatus Saccharibacteria bacterium]|nr:alpha/beta fold hydrolase [Candidatus Saccharibacteria bacterium]